MAAGGEYPHFRLIPAGNTFERLFQSPVSISEDPQSALDRYKVSQMELSKYLTGPREFGEKSRAEVNKNISRLKTYLKYEPDIDTMTDEEKIDFFNTLKPNASDFETAFNTYVLGGRDIIDISRNSQEAIVDGVLDALSDFSKPSVSVPILIEGMEYSLPNARGHVIVVTRRGNDIEVFDPSAINLKHYKPTFRNAFSNFLEYLKYLAESNGGNLIMNTQMVNPHGFCDSISCVRALHKDLPLDEFTKRFIVPAHPELSHGYLLKEYYKTELPKTIFVKSINTLEPYAAEIERQEMNYEDFLSRQIRDAFKKEKAKLKMEDLFKRKSE